MQEYKHNTCGLMESQKYISKIQQLDEIYRNSPTAQILASHAPAVLSIFREMRQEMAVRRMEIDRICAERHANLEKFRLIAGPLTNEVAHIGQEIRNLQKTVREKAALLGNDPTVQIEINYTNQQISDLIDMFNSLTNKLIMA